ncbi:peptide ABC transporter substrate-binding protein [Ktedonosporobacter rubrisoli]|uniref:Peptide ABC transporter substrate-binding protein n=1 Tax=Ktedonosporobacter rubrisoli TaxID=2509675 RepID=A0A4P6K009_KTERU|nr:peptide ABC transporter substrate-binding protein [Ktedonosporobacter rubrisoli]QBD80950.1 peptide ABC transporter substrate-binding protein [Ktedonosporobacter rubrisoli]
MSLTKRMLFPLFCLLAMLMVACGGNSAGTTSTPAQQNHPKAPDNKQVLITSVGVAGVSDFDTLDPAKAPDFNAQTAISVMFTGLVSLDDNLKIKPQLAQSWDKSADGYTYTFHLRPNLKFNDGTPLTSHDVAYSIDRAFQPALKSTTAPNYLRYIKDSDKLNSGAIKTIIGDSLLTPDDNTIIIKLSKPVAYFLDALAFQSSFVVEKSLLQKYGEFGTSWLDHLNEGGGDGPFKVKSYMHNKEIVFVPNPYYYGAKPQLKELIMPLYQHVDTTKKDYEIGRLDDATVPQVDFARDKQRKDFFQTLFLAISYYTMNFNQKPFDNIHIRQAFALAINKDLLAKNVWKGSFVATNHIVPEGMYGYNPNLTGPDGTKSTAGNPQKAKALLQQGMQEEGYSSVSQIPPITLTFASGGNQAVRDEVAAMQQMWQQALGITVKTNDIDLNTIFTDQGLGANNPLSFYTGPSWVADYPDPQDWITLQFGKGTAQNAMNFGENKGPDAAAEQALQAQMLEADTTQDPTARLQAYNKIEQQLVNDVAWLPVEQQTFFGLRKPCVQGFGLSDQGLTNPDDWGKTYISTDQPCVNATVS